jgi:hypothetical protein
MADFCCGWSRPCLPTNERRCYPSDTQQRQKGDHYVDHIFETS